MRCLASQPLQVMMTTPGMRCDVMEWVGWATACVRQLGKLLAAPRVALVAREFNLQPRLGLASTGCGWRRLHPVTQGPRGRAGKDNALRHKPPAPRTHLRSIG